MILTTESIKEKPELKTWTKKASLKHFRELNTAGVENKEGWEIEVKDIAEFRSEYGIDFNLNGIKAIGGIWP